MVTGRVRAGQGLGPGVAALGTVGGFLALAALFAVAIGRPDSVIALGAVLLAALTILRWPIAGVYLTVVTTTLLDMFPSPYTSTVLSDMGFFRNLNVLGLPKSISFSMFEVLLVVALLRVIIGRFSRDEPLVRGPLLGPMLVFATIVLAGEANGLLTGGDFKISLWEIRPLAYLVLLYILAVNTVREPRHIRALLWITIVSTAIRVLHGLWRYMQMPASVKATAETVLEHDDSLVLAAAIGLVIAATLWRAYLPQRFYLAIVALVPPVVLMMAWNKRRAVFLCAGLFVLVILPILWRNLRAKATRRRFITAFLLGVILCGGYIGVFWNQTGGLAAPARAVKSVFQPGERDYLSNLYRQQEDQNLRATIARSPLVGIGFGKPMDIVVVMADVSSKWGLQLYTPHDNILWLWERMGLVGFAAFWALIGSIILLAVAGVRQSLDGLRQAVAEGSQTSWLQPRGAARRRSTGRLTSPPDRTAQECAEFLVFSLLLLSMLASLMALGSADQGFMSFRLMALVGAIVGAQAGAWHTYARSFASIPGAITRQVVPEERPTHVHRRQIQIVAMS